MAQNTVTNERLRAIAEGFPGDLVDAQIEDIPRVAFHLDLVARRAGVDVTICDVGSGVGLFPAACAEAGMQITMMDDFAPPFADEESARAVPDAPDAVNFDRVDDALRYHRSRGVEVAARDPLAEGFGFGPASLDVVTTFDSMEHWHRSPKWLFREILEALRPGGLFVIGVPNCVNLRKRITVPLGYGKWSQMSHWYEPEYFRGHVREPDVDDLHYIARDLGLEEVEIVGRNWAGLLSPNPWVRRLTAVADPVLIHCPSLCSDLYLMGRKPR